jgi:CRISPR-associated DxTHG motif protein
MTADAQPVVTAISFLGTSNYQETEYVYRGRARRTRLFPAALLYLCPEVRSLRVLVTEQARQRWEHELTREIDRLRTPGQSWSLVPIPEGRSEDELWALFSTLVRQVEEDDAVLLDITHGFRSLPLIAAVATAYLRVARGVRLHGLLYGAYEARDAEDRAPVFDLTPLVSLLDWTAAADLFRRAGNAEPLAGLLAETQNTLHRARRGAAGLPTRLKSAAATLRGLSRALRLLRVREAMEHAAELQRDLAEQAVVEEIGQWASPFAVLLAQARRVVEPLSLPAAAGDPRRELAVQRELIRWYLRNGWDLEAVLLAREWLISVQAYRAGRHLLEDRAAVEGAIETAARGRRDGTPEAGRTAPVPLDTAAVDPEIAELWNWLHDLRNDLAHCGMRPGPRPADRVQRAVAELDERLARVWPEPGDA